MNNTGSCSQNYSSTKQTDRSEIFIFLKDTKRHSHSVKWSERKRVGKYRLTVFVSKKAPPTPVTVKIKIIYFLESGSGYIVHQVRDILGLVTLHKTDLMVPPASINN